MRALGFRGSARDVDGLLRATRPSTPGVAVQLLDAALVCGPVHLEQAVRLARRAFERGTNSARELGLELLLYASAERQLEKALAKMGVTKATTTLAVCVAAAEPADGDEARAAEEVEAALARLGWTRDDAVLEPTPEKLRRFGVTAAELETVGAEKAADLVLERVALVDALK